MTESSPAPRDPGLAEARDAWLEVSDDLLAGIGHALNNRVAAVAAVGQVLAATTEGPLTGALSAESARLQRVVQLMRLLIRRWNADPEPIQLEEVLGSVVELLSHHPELRRTTIRVEAEPGLAPVLSERSSLTHAFCLLLTAAATAAERRGDEELRVRCAATPEEVTVEIPAPGPGAAAGEGSEQPPGATFDPCAARGLLERSGGSVSLREENGAPAVLLVRVPTLMEIRRRERAG